MLVFQGGEVTPLFAIGASLGLVLARLFGLPLALGAALGYVAVFGAGTNTFLAPIAIGWNCLAHNTFICSLSFVRFHIYLIKIYPSIHFKK